MAEDSALATAAPTRPARAKVIVLNDSTSTPLRGASVEIWSIHTGLTKADGSWTSKVFPSGTYDSKIFLAGFGPVTPPGVPRQEFTLIQSVTFDPLTAAIPMTVINVRLAQALPRAIVTVIDPNRNNEVVKGAEVEVVGQVMGPTDSKGIFTSPAFQTGHFDLKVRKIFYGPPTSSSPVVEGEFLNPGADFTATADVVLTVSMINTVGKVRSSNIKVGGQDFVDWFNNVFRPRVPATHPTVRIADVPAPTFPSTLNKTRFQDAFDHCDRILAPEMTVEEFVATFLIFYNESGGTLLPIPEKGGPKYMFEPRSSVHKASYNGGQNRLAGNQLLASGAISTPADVAAWNSQVTYPDPPAGSALDIAARECDFFKYRGRGFIQITFLSNYLAHVAPALRAAGHGAGQTNMQMLESISDATLTTLVLTDPNIFFPMTKSFFLAVRGQLDKVNQREWKPFAFAIAGHNPPYAELFDFRCTHLLDEMKKDGFVLS